VYELDLNERIDNCIYVSGSFEPATANAIRRLLRPGCVALDIGANIGCHSLPMAKLVGSLGKVIAFEPMKDALAKLNKNISLNPCLASRITVVQSALGDCCQTESICFRTSWPYFGEPKYSAEAVSIVTLDSYAAGLPRVDFAKIDVDGYEGKVIAGALQTLKKHRPALVIEICTATATLVATTLHSLGYTLLNENFVQMGEITVPPDQTINVIALAD
jgi:FkbM family methyltransferase